MKKIFRIILIIILLIIAAIIIIPVIFKDQIFTRVKYEINQNVNAKVDFTDFNLSMIRNFPNLSASLKGLSVMGTGEFEGDTLAAFQSFGATIDLLSVFGKKIEIRSVFLDQPVINALINEDGAANWDIAVPSEKTGEPDTAPPGSFEMTFQIDEFAIREARIIYHDKKSGMKAGLDDLFFNMTGDLSQDFTILNIHSGIQRVNFIYSGIRYVRDARLEMAFDLDADLANSVYTLKDNKISLNDLWLAFQGEVSMPDEENTVVDMRFETSKTDFRSLLSLVPAVYMKNFEDIEASGTMGLRGYVKGTLNEKVTPSAGLELKVENGMFRYPDLPKTADQINIEAVLRYDGVHNDNTVVDIRRFHVDLGGNPVNFSMHLVTPVSDPTISAHLDSEIDFASLSDVIPLEETQLQGNLRANLDMMGSLSMIEKEKYQDFKADGTVRMADFRFASEDLPVPVFISGSRLGFSPEFVELYSLDAGIGRSDVHLHGRIENFIPFVLSDGTIQGTLDLRSDLLDVNEFMTEEETGETSEEDSLAFSVIEVPANIDFRFTSELDRVIMNKLVVENILGIIEVRDKKIMLTDLNMDLLKGSVLANGEYNTQDIKSPMIDFHLDVRDMDIPSAFNAFNTVEKLAPIAGSCEGKVSAGLEINSFLDKHMKPVMSSMVGEGNLRSENITVNNSNIFSKMGELLQNNKYKKLTLQDVYVNFEIRNGRVYVEPFETSFGSTEMVVQGDQGIDGTMNYRIDVEAPREELGAGVNNLLDDLSDRVGREGFHLDPGDKIEVAFHVSGTFSEPRINMGLGDQASRVTGQIKEQAVERVQEEIGKAKEKIEEKADQEAEKILREAEEQVRRIRKEAEKAGDELIRLAGEEGQKRIEEAGNNPLKKIAARKYAETLTKEAEEKAARLKEEADKKAEAVLEEAREKID